MARIWVLCCSFAVHACGDASGVGGGDGSDGATGTGDGGGAPACALAGTFVVCGAAARDEVGASVAPAGSFLGGEGPAFVFGTASSAQGGVVQIGAPGAAIRADRVGVDAPGRIIQAGLGGLAAVGDVNGDGIDDVATGGAFVGGPPGSQTGALYVVFGGTEGPVDLDTIGEEVPGVRIAGLEDEQLGFSVVGAGDVNGDGLSDILVSALGPRHVAGMAYVVFGRSDGSWPADTGSLAVDAGLALPGAAEGDNAGRVIGRAGDANGDGFDDVLVMAELGQHGFERAPRAYVVLGRSEPGMVPLADVAEGSGGYVVEGSPEGSPNCEPAAYGPPGDVNGDGLDDLVLSMAACEALIGGLSGRTFIVFGTSDPERVDLLTLVDDGRGIFIDGDADLLLAGYAAASGTDVDGDGFDDVLVGAPSAHDQGGAVHLVHGRAEATTLRLAEDGMEVHLGSATEEAGTSVAFGPTWNGDPTILIGAPRFSAAGEEDTFTGRLIVRPITR